MAHKAVLAGYLQGGGSIEWRQGGAVSVSCGLLPFLLAEPSIEDELTDNLEIRRRRAHYRAHHRGTKEMDIFIGRYAVARLDDFDADALGRFEAFMDVPEPTLDKWLFNKESAVGTGFEDLVDEIRAFHGLAKIAKDTGIR